MSQKKVFSDLGNIEKCGFDYSIQDVSNNTFQVFLDVKKFWPILLYFMGNIGVKIFQVFKNGSNWFYLIEQASDMSKIKLLLIFYVCCLNKTTKTINELTNEQPRSHFFLTDPLYVSLKLWCYELSGKDKGSVKKK